MQKHATTSWKPEERYYSFGRFLKERFASKVYKIPINAGFTCPNLDGKLGFGGCSYCSNESFSPNVTDNVRSIKDQVKSGKEFLRKRYGAEKFIVYFQSFSNTYKEVDVLKEKYEQALEEDDIIGISIGTRPDCVSDEILELIGSYTNTYHTWIEYGLQSIHDRTLQKINRGHSFKDCEDAVNRTKDFGILVCLHVILGLPDENWNDMMETADTVSTLNIDGIKIHHLYVSKNTALAEEYFNGNVKTMLLDEYIPSVVDFLERTSPKITVQRLMGDTHGKFLISPIWSVSKSKVLELINSEFEKRGTFQGSKCGLKDYQLVV
ncbi:MAG: TIGR01212 family radical SAM protein [Candidatus Anammoxibacter sp.]